MNQYEAEIERDRKKLLHNALSFFALISVIAIAGIAWLRLSH